MNGVSNVTVTGFSGSSSSGGLLVEVAGYGNNSNITFSHNAMNTGGVVIRNGSANANITITENQFVGFASASETGRMLVYTTSPCPNGVTISHNLMSGGVADGIDIDGGTCGTQILYNVITNIIQANCGAIHCDAIQDNGGGLDTVIDGNWIYNTTDCFGLYDGTTGYLIENNECGPGAVDTSYWMQFGGASGITFDHNTITSTAGAVYGNSNAGQPSSNVTFTNNIWPSKPSDRPGQPVSGTFNDSYNLCASGCSGSQDITGSPTFVGGSAPSTWAGFALTAGSLGVGNASDGQNRGITTFSQVPGL
jgi:hypothetical protein